MTANQRRPGFRLPWSLESDEPAAEAEAVASAEATESAPPTHAAPADAAPADATPALETVSSGEPATAAEPAAAAAVTEPVAAAQPAAEGPDHFMRDLVAAMRGVADEAREAGLTELKTQAEERVRQLEADSERRREELRARAEADIAGVAEWAAAETERIKAEAEQRVVSRRAKLDQQLAADTIRTEDDSKAIRDRVAEYERELDAYHAQLTEIGDPAAFAAAAKRMPKPPSLTGAPAMTAPAAAPAEPVAAPVAAQAEAAPEPPAGEAVAPAVGPAEAEPAATNGGPSDHVSDAAVTGDEALASRLAALDATLPENGTTPAAASGEPVTTEVIVKGLGSFGAITGFRQSLSGVTGIDGVALSLGQTGEFVFRATHAPGFDMRGAIVGLEGDGAKVEERPEGGLRVTLERPR